ncbi:MAG TPA: hypothetical protein VGQ62_22890 [Chloroflexota bacterium]|nr:hypothetical protein [Chloroflexota bacterium]
MGNDRERRLHLLVGFRYIPLHLEGLVAVLLFLVALVLGAAVAMLVRSLPGV